MLKRFFTLIAISITLFSKLQAEHLLDTYAGIGPNGPTLGANYSHKLFGRFGYQIGGAYSFGSVTGTAYAANLLLTFTTPFKKYHQITLKGGAAYWQRDIGELSETTQYYNYGFSYYYTFNPKQAVGFDYYLNAYGISYRYRF